MNNHIRSYMFLMLLAPLSAFITYIITKIWEFTIYTNLVGAILTIIITYLLYLSKRYSNKSDLGIIVISSLFFILLSLWVLNSNIYGKHFYYIHITIFKYYILYYFILLIVIIFMYLFNQLYKYTNYINISFKITKKWQRNYRYIFIFFPFIISIIKSLLNKNLFSTTNTITIKSAPLMTLIFAIITTLSENKESRVNQIYLGEDISNYLYINKFVNALKDNNYYNICFTYVIIFPCFLFIFNISELNTFYSKYLYYLWQSMFIFIIIIIISVIISNSYVNKVSQRLNSTNIRDLKTIKIKLNHYIISKLSFLIKNDIYHRTHTHYLKRTIKRELYCIDNITSHNELTQDIYNQKAALLLLIFKSLRHSKNTILRFNGGYLLSEYNDINHVIQNTDLDLNVHEIDKIIQQHILLIKYIFNNNQIIFSKVFTRHNNYKKKFIPDFMLKNLTNNSQWINFNKNIKILLKDDKINYPDKLFKLYFSVVIEKEMQYINTNYTIRSMNSSNSIITLLTTLKQISPHFYNKYCKNHGHLVAFYLVR